MSKIQDMIAQLCPDGVEYLKMSDVFEFRNGYTPSKNNSAFWEGGTIPWFRMEDIRTNGRVLSDAIQHITPAAIKGKGLFKANSFILATTATIGEHALIIADSLANQRFTNLEICKSLASRIDVKYMFHYFFIIDEWCKQNINMSGFASVDMKGLKNLEIPIPPLPIQEEIARILDKFTQLEAELEAELDCRKRQYEYYREKLLAFEGDESAEWKPMSEIVKAINTGLNPRKFFALNTPDAENYYITIKEMHGGKIVVSDKTDRINDKALMLCNNRSNLEVGDLLFSGTGTIGVTVIVKEKPVNWNIKEGVYNIKPKKEIVCVDYLRYILGSSRIRDSYMKKVAGGTVKSIPMKSLASLKIPIPPLSEQERIVAILDRFEALTNSISEGLPAEMAARRQQYEHYRDQLLTFKRKAA